MNGGGAPHVGRPAARGDVGVVGGYGAVGAVVADRLAAWGCGPLRLGGRDPDRAAAAAARLGHGARPVRVDVSRPDDLAAFAAGCRLVVNCAGPAVTIGDTVARAARAAGADYVDAAGDDDLYDRVAARDPGTGTAVVSAGMMPGLTGLLPRLLAAQVDRPRRLTGWVGGRDRFTPTAALDYLASFHTFGETRAGWRDGRRVARVAGVAPEARVPFFPGPVATVPYLSTETERLAAAWGLREATWFSVFDGPRLWEALRRPASPEQDPSAQAALVARAADLDLFGAEPYQLVVVELAADDRTRTVVLRATGASLLTGLLAALTARAVLAGTVPPGTHHAADVLDPAATAAALADCPGVLALDVLDGPADRIPVEEGVL